MPFTLPNPTSPTNGQSLDATPILANEVALANAIASFDGSQIQSGTITGSALASTANPNTLLAAITFPFVQSGCVWTTVSGLAGTMSGGTIYYNGVPVTVGSVASKTFTASQDTYVDVDKNGNVTYQGVTNNTASPSLTANSVRVAIIVTGASAITFINIGQTNTALSGFAPIASSIPYTVCDSLGNLIYPTDPNSRVLGYRQIIANVVSVTGNTPGAVTGLSVPVIPPTNRKVKITVWTGFLSAGSTGSANIRLDIWSGVVGSGTRLASSQPFAVTSSTSVVPTTTMAFDIPSTSVTYNAAMSADNTNNATVGASSTNPSFILVELE